MQGQLIFKDGTKFEGTSFGSEEAMAGEVVFATGMVGYPEAITDPSFAGQILVMTYPIIGNYGVPDKQLWESDKVHTSGLIVSNYIDTPSHWQSNMTLSQWLKEQHVPALEIKDTRLLTQYLRDNGSQLGKIIFTTDIPFYDPNQDAIVAKVSTKKMTIQGSGEKTIVLIDCGTKRNMQQCLVNRGVRVITVPWDFDPFEENLSFDGLIISNGPGDPKMVTKTIQTIKKALENKTPILGVCLGNQLLALAAGGNTYKLKFGHRSQNQPAIETKTNRCYITTQNHGFAIADLPKEFSPWFINANDGSNEGIIHDTLPYMSTQFHPEAHPGPSDTEWVFDYFLEKIL